MSVADYMTNLLLTCPHIAVGPLDLHVDSAESRPTNYSIDSEPVSPVLKHYLNGDRLKQYVFSLGARKETFDDEDRKENAATFEQVSRWMEQQTRSRVLPPMGVGQQPMRLEALDSVYLLERAEDNETGLYAMQCRLTYYEKMEE